MAPQPNLCSGVRCVLLPFLPLLFLLSLAAEITSGASAASGRDQTRRPVRSQTAKLGGGGGGLHGSRWDAFRSNHEEASEASSLHKESRTIDEERRTRYAFVKGTTIASIPTIKRRRRSSRNLQVSSDAAPSAAPSVSPTQRPSIHPSSSPTISHVPTRSPRPSSTPTSSPKPTLSPAPSTSPSLSPQPTLGPSVPPSLEPSSFPTDRPSASTRPSGEPVDYKVTIVIDLDANPQEVGWRIEAVGGGGGDVVPEIIAQIEAGYYGSRDRRGVHTVTLTSVAQQQQFRFVVTDTYGDGIQGSTGGYSVYFGTQSSIGNDDALLVRGDGNFQYETSQLLPPLSGFVVPTTSPSPSVRTSAVPTVSARPSETPSLAPTASYRPSGMPSKLESAVPSWVPSRRPTTGEPTSVPTTKPTSSSPTPGPTEDPTPPPTPAPTTRPPTPAPTTPAPTPVPTAAPTVVSPQTNVSPTAPPPPPPTPAPAPAPTVAGPGPTPGPTPASSPSSEVVVEEEAENREPGGGPEPTAQDPEPTTPAPAAPTAAAPAPAPDDSPTPTTPEPTPPSTSSPTPGPTPEPTTPQPTPSPTTPEPTPSPTSQPTTAIPTSAAPTSNPTTAVPSSYPSLRPTTTHPSPGPSRMPSTAPTIDDGLSFTSVTYTLAVHHGFDVTENEVIARVADVVNGTIWDSLRGNGGGPEYDSLSQLASGASALTLFSVDDASVDPTRACVSASITNRCTVVRITAVASRLDGVNPLVDDGLVRYALLDVTPSLVRNLDLEFGAGASSLGPRTVSVTNTLAIAGVTMGVDVVDDAGSLSADRTEEIMAAYEGTFRTFLGQSLEGGSYDFTVLDVEVINVTLVEDERDNIFDDTQVTTRRVRRARQLQPTSAAAATALFETRILGEYPTTSSLDITLNSVIIDNVDSLVTGLSDGDDQRGTNYFDGLENILLWTQSPTQAPSPSPVEQEGRSPEEKEPGEEPSKLIEEEPHTQGGGGLSRGAKAGIIVSCIVVVFAGIAFFAARHYKRRQQQVHPPVVVDEGLIDDKSVDSSLSNMMREGDGVETAAMSETVAFSESSGAAAAAKHPPSLLRSASQDESEESWGPSEDGFVDFSRH